MNSFVPCRETVGESQHRGRPVRSRLTSFGCAAVLLVLMLLALRAQPDTIPGAPPAKSLLACMEFSADCRSRAGHRYSNEPKPLAGIWLSTDRGVTFAPRDSTVVSPNLIALPPSKRSGHSAYGPIWQFDSAGMPVFSTDYGLSWNSTALPQNTAHAAVSADGVSQTGDLFWYSSATVILTRSNGQSWDTLPFSATAATLYWYDSMHAVRALTGKLIARTAMAVGRGIHSRSRGSSPALSATLSQISFISNPSHSIRLSTSSALTPEGHGRLSMLTIISRSFGTAFGMA